MNNNQFNRFLNLDIKEGSYNCCDQLSIEIDCQISMSIRNLSLLKQRDFLLLRTERF